MDKKQLLEKLKEAQEAINAFQKENKYNPANSQINRFKAPLASLIQRLGGNAANPFKQVVITNPAPIEQPRTVETEPEEQGKILANNAETPEAKQEQKKKRRGRPKKKAE
jgi:hypothetical protein